MEEVKEVRKSHKVLSLDLGTNVGWAVGTDAVIQYSGTKSFYQKDSHPGLRFIRFSNWLLKFKGVDEIFYEVIPFTKFAKAHEVYAGMLAVLQMFALGNEIRMTGVKPTTVKKEFVGNGRASKTEVCNAAIKLGWWGGKLDTEKDNDEADACAVFYTVLKKRGVDVTFSNEKN